MDKLKIPVQRLNAEFAPETANKENRTVNLKWYTGATVPRAPFFSEPYNLTFSMDPSHVRMGRFQSGKAPLLDSHSQQSLKSIIGVIEFANLDGTAQVRFSNRPDVAPIWQDVQDGIIRNASMGAMIYKMRNVTKDGETMKHYMAVDWEPMELSLLPMGADPNAGLSPQDSVEVEIESGAPAPQKEVNMNQETQGGTAPASVAQPVPVVDTEKLKAEAAQAERLRASEITALGQKAKLEPAVIKEHIAKGTSVEQFRVIAFDALAANSAENPTREHHAELTRDETDTRRELFEGAITGLMNSKEPAKEDNPYRGLGILRIAEESVRLQHRLNHIPSRARVIELAMQNTSDFANVLENTARKQLLTRYNAATPTYRIWTKPSTTPDFKTMSRTRLSEVPAFLVVAEGGQIAIGKMSDSKETYALATYGRGVSFTRQMLINDDLGAFTDLIGQFGIQAARLENKTVYAILTANANMADSNPLFDASHGNSGTGVIGNTALDAMFTAMGTQKGLDGTTVLNLTPQYLIVPKAKEATARTSQIAIGPNVKVSDQNWFAGRLTVVADAELDASSTAKWYGAADPGSAPGIEYAHLDGAEGPQFIRKDNDQGILGVQFYAFLDFGAKAVDWRPLYYSTGA